MEKAYEARDYYVLYGQWYVGEGVFYWEEVSEELDSHDECVAAYENMKDDSEYLDWKIEHHTVTVTLKPKNDLVNPNAHLN